LQLSKVYRYKVCVQQCRWWHYNIPMHKNVLQVSDSKKRARSCWNTVIVGYKDRCTKNKGLFRIPKCVLFLTCTENSFFFWIHIFKWVCACYLLKRIQLTWEDSPLFMVGNFPSTQVSLLLKANCPCAPYISLTPAPTPHVQIIYFFYTKTTLTSPILLSGKVAAYDFLVLSWNS
jgi:hypothetical protein